MSSCLIQTYLVAIVDGLRLSFLFRSGLITLIRCSRNSNDICRVLSNCFRAIQCLSSGGNHKDRDSLHRLDRRQSDAMARGQHVLSCLFISYENARQTLWSCDASDTKEEKTTRLLNAIICVRTSDRPWLRLDGAPTTSNAPLCMEETGVASCITTI